MTKPDTEEAFRTIVAEALGQPLLQLQRDQSAADHAGWDSVRQVAIILAVEDHFSITLRSREIDNLRTVGDFLDLIEAKTQ